MHLTSTFVFDSAEAGGAAFAGTSDAHFYTRISNPTSALLERRIAELELAKAGIVTASGIGAITSVLWTFLSAGDEVVTDKTLYGCTFAFMRDGLRKFGVKVIHVDMVEPENIRSAITPRTKIICFETPTNPNMRLVDIAAVSKIARDHTGVRVVADNTYATPYLTQPIAFGADIVVHSATKYIGGHVDIIAGLAVGTKEDMLRVRLEGIKDMTGSVMASFNSILALRGLKTLKLRMDQHCRCALEIAQALEAPPAVDKVHYPGLTSFPQHLIAQKQMSQFGGMIAFELKGGFPSGIALINHTKMIHCAVSLGDTETVIQHPASMTHSAYSSEECIQHGISEHLIRLSIGLEETADIWADLEHALAKLS